VRSRLCSGFLIWSLRGALPGIRPGGRPSFLCLPKEKKAKERAPRSLGRPRADCSALLGLGVSGRTHSASFARCVQTAARSQMTKRASHATPSPALLDGSQGPRETLARFAGLVLSARFASCWRSGPLCGPVPGGDAKRAERCARGWRRGAQGLRGARVSAHQQLTSRRLSERSAQRARSEFGATPQDRAPQSSPASGRTATVGSPFFDYFLWRSKESNSAAGPRPGMQPRSEKP
jgi:hypothetical protein